MCIFFYIMIESNVISLLRQALTHKNDFGGAIKNG